MYYNFTICGLLFLGLICLQTQLAESGQWYDDGNIVEKIDESDEVNNTRTEDFEKGTHHLGRQLLKPFLNAASRVGKVLNRVTDSTGLDTNDTLVSGAIESFKKRIQIIYPGTRWCGDGDKARSDDDLGRFKATDECCRAHDKCFDYIAAGESKYGLHNSGLFTRSHCKCDNNFYQCLKAADQLIAHKIGFTYFSILGPQCFNETAPAKCEQYSRGKCIQYKYAELKDKDKGKLYQWFDSPMFL